MATVWIVLVQFVCIQLISATITNIASGTKPSMSSNIGGYHASTAVDGHTNAVYPGGIINTNTSHTTAWWKVDLERNVQDATVKIYFRTDYKKRRNGVQLYTSTTSFSMFPSGQLCHTFTGRADGTDIQNVVSVNCTGTWRYLMVYTQTDNVGDGAVLDFGEVEVFACSIGNYGPDCTKSCSSRQCVVTPTSCYRYTAACPDGRCKTGWTGSDCTEECLSGTYGQNCMKSCTSRQCAVTPTSCDRGTGACPSGGCLAGYKGSDCTNGCSSGFYGKNCVKSCGSRKCVTMSTTCDSVTGVCSGGCQSGWRGPDCTLSCSSGFYGHNCVKSCGSRKCVTMSTTCDSVTGVCSGGCQPGWRGPDCTLICSTGTYGENCMKSCASRQCAVTPTSCDRVTGACPSGECLAGYKGSDCTQGCSSGFYGKNCVKSCGSRECVTMSTTCDSVTGVCSGGCQSGWRGTDCSLMCSQSTYGSACNMSCENRKCGSSLSPCDSVTGKCADECQPGWKGTDCTQICDKGRYGPGCNYTCGNCADGASCDHRTGNCSGVCAAGWQQGKCLQKCKQGKYGVNCAEDCGQCAGRCNITTGHCQGGCRTGYNGSLCKENLEMPEDQDKRGYIIPAVAGAAAGLLVFSIVIVVFIVYRRRRNLTSTEPKLGGKRPLFVPNGSSAATSLKNEVNVYENVALEPVETMPTVTPTLHAKTISTKTGLKPKLIVQEDDEQEEEILEESDPVTNGDYYNDIEDVIREISVEDLEDTVQKIKHRKGGFEAEYGRLPTGFTASYDDSRKPENAGKNKFIGYYPYDYNRVRLSVLPNIPGSDYINASIMHSYDQRKTYIAAQAPNKKTVGDFWRMIWEHQCGLVIMLTGLVEDMTVKCYQYWPVDGVLETDHYQVKVEVTDTRANYTVRDIEVTSKETGQVRTTVQYHFTSWPDHGVPDTLSLVNFIWMIRRTYRETDGPLLVHCSAGIGRTGTYIAVDSLLDQAQGEGVVDVMGYVSAMRGQRKNMIQTKEQYECVFQCLVEMTKFGDTSMDVENFANSYINRFMKNTVDRKRLWEITQLMLTEERDSTSSPPRMWVDGNQDFIVRVGPTLRLLKGYLLAETPPKGLERLLWKLVEENNVDIVVAVSPLKVNIFGDKGNTKKYGGISLTTTDQTSLTSDLTLVFLSIKRGEFVHNVKLYKLNGSLTLNNMSSLLLDHAHLQHLSAGMSPVVLIHDETDRKATVLFSIMGNILSGIEEDRRVDVIGHVRAFLKCCPDLVFTQQDMTKLLELAQKRVKLMGTGNTYANM